MTTYNSSFDEFNDLLYDIYRALFLGYGIAELGIAGTILLVAIIAILVSALVALVIFILEAYPLYRLAKKTGRSHAWLAWVPIFGSYFRLYVLSDIAGNKELSFFNGQFVLKDRKLSFWIYVGIALFGSALITAVISIIALIPVLGQIVSTVSWLLYFVPAIACGLMEYAYLRDVLDIFKEDQQSNRTAAIVITILDSLATLGFARVVYLYTLLKYDPLPENIVE